MGWFSIKKIRLTLHVFIVIIVMHYFLSPLYMSDSVLDTKTSMISFTHVSLYSFSKYSLSQNLLLEALREVLKV